MKRIVLIISLFFALSSLALAAGHHPQLKLNAADQSGAKKLLLQKAVVGAGFTDAGQDSGGSSDLFCPSYNPNLSSLTETASVYGHDFTTSLGDFISSKAMVFVNAAQASRAFSAVKNPKVGICFKQLAAKSLAKLKPKNAHISSKPIRVGSFKGYGWSYQAQITVSKGVTLPYTIVFFYYLKGRAVSTLFVAGFQSAKLASAARDASAAMAEEIGLSQF